MKEQEGKRERESGEGGVGRGGGRKSGWVGKEGGGTFVFSHCAQCY